jgi:hypothetical protein
MDTVKEWGLSEFKRLQPDSIFQRDELAILFDNLCKEDPSKISTELSNLLDFSVKENKQFITEFQGRVESVLQYQEKAKKVQTSTTIKYKEAGHNKATK